MLFLIPICIVPVMEKCWPGTLQSILNRNNFATDRYCANIVKTWSLVRAVLSDIKYKTVKNITIDERAVPLYFASKI